MKLDRVAYLLILLYPISAVTIKVLPPLIFVILALMGVYISIRDRLSPFAVPKLRLLSWVTLGYFSIMVLSVALSSEPTVEWTHLSRKIQFLLAPFVALMFYHIDVSIKKVISSIKIGTLIAGAIVVVEYIWGVDGRLSGMFNPNSFADMLSIMLLVVMVSIVKESKKEYLWSLVAVLLATVAIVLSGAKGSMLSFLLMLPLVGYMLYITSTNHRMRILVVLVSTISVFAFTSISLTNLEDRVGDITKNIDRWESDIGVDSSVGIRLEMYRSGLWAFSHSPWVGYGYREANLVASRYATVGAEKRVAHYTHLHNEVLTNMVSAGAIGLVALLLLYLLPLREFIVNLRERRELQESMIGVILIVGYLLLGMTHGMLEWEYENSFFVYFLALVMVSGAKSNEAPLGLQSH